MDTLQIQISVGQALHELRVKIQERIKAVVHGTVPETERQTCWLAIKSLQRAEALMREALEIVSC